MTFIDISVAGLAISTALMAWELYKIKTFTDETLEVIDKFYESTNSNFGLLAEFRDVAADNFENIQQVNDNVRDEIVRLNLKISMLQKKLGGR